MFLQSLTCLLDGMAVGFSSFCEIYIAIDSIKEQLIASIIGVPVITVSIVFGYISIAKIVTRII